MRRDRVSPSIVRSVRAEDGKELNPWGDRIHVMLGPRLDGLTEVVQVVNNVRCEELCRVTSLKTVWGARRQVVFPVPDQRCERRAIQSAHKSESIA